MCNCLKKTEKEIKERLIAGLKKNSIEVSEFINEGESGFQCKGLMFSSGRWEFILPMEYKYRRLKKTGDPDKRVATYKTNIIPLFCPICGEKTVVKDKSKSLK